MKKITLKELELTNYRNIEHATFKFDGNSKIVGDNRIGKTNVLEAICFLLSNRLLNGVSDLTGIKPTKDTKLVVSVKGTFDVDGKEIVIQKDYGENWVKQRATNEIILKGHFEEYYYNDVKQGSESSFNDLFYKDFGLHQEPSLKLDMINLSLDPSYVGEKCESIEWQEIRKLIIQLVGDVKDEDVYQREQSTLAIKNDMEFHNYRVDQVRKKVRDDINQLKEDIIADEAKVETFKSATKPSDEEIAVAKKGIADIEEDIAKLKSTVGNVELETKIKNDIANINLEISQEKEKEVKSDPASELVVELNSLYEEEHKLTTEMSKLRGEAGDLNIQIKSKENSLEFTKKKLADLLVEYKSLKSKQAVVETVCPTCHRPLEASQIEAAKARFETERNTKLNLNIEAGKKLRIEEDSLKKDITNLQVKRVDYQPKLNELSLKVGSVSSKITELEDKINSLRANTETVVNPVIAELTAKKEKLEQDLISLRTSEETARNSRNQAIYELEEKKLPFNKVLSDLDYYNRQSEELKKAEELLKKHNTDLIGFEQKKDLIDKFVFTKLSMLDENVAKVFGNIKFQLIKENINGGFDTVCKPYIYDPITKESTNVLWKSGSKSERIATGIAIAEVVKSKLNLSNLPFLFDEGGEISSETMKTRLQTESQIICVKVQDGIATPIVMPLE